MARRTVPLPLPLPKRTRPRCGETGGRPPEERREGGESAPLPSPFQDLCPSTVPLPEPPHVRPPPQGPVCVCLWVPVQSESCFCGCIDQPGFTLHKDHAYTGHALLTRGMRHKLLAGFLRPISSPIGSLLSVPDPSHVNVKISRTSFSKLVSKTMYLRVYLSRYI